ncbi:eukaryotic translation initiation factor 3 subunit G-like [Lotus japonicus]|uniref:eukaryotic translation initiation factor 3 subunit G-like n=1 Tax=Lotus japonicus TaxID=34305 RepID=UPI00258A62AA|nr:eukaryotic translation initiation factor 3 subunit G-like [Lotus japonicus]
MAGPTGSARVSQIHGRNKGGRRSFRKLERREGVTLFVDGLNDRVTYKVLRRIFEKYGQVESVFLPRAKKKGRRFRFGFIHFKARSEGFRAMEGWHRRRLHNVFLTVQPAKFPLLQRRERSEMKGGARSHHNIIKLVWKRKEDNGQEVLNTRKPSIRKEWRVKRKPPE